MTSSWRALACHGAATVVEAIDIAPDAKICSWKRWKKPRRAATHRFRPDGGSTSIRMDIEKFREYMWALGEPNPIPEEWFDWWIEAMVYQIDWITDVAESVGYGGVPKEWGDAIMEFPDMPGSQFRSISNSLCKMPGTATQAGGTYTAFANVVKQLKGVDIRYEDACDRPHPGSDTGEVYGVTARDKDGNLFNVRATKGVVLACGGYENNLEMQRDFHGMDNVYTTGTPGNTGDRHSNAHEGRREDLAHEEHDAVRRFLAGHQGSGISFRVPCASSISPTAAGLRSTPRAAASTTNPSIITSST